MMLEVAGGVIIGGIVLYILYEFRELVAKIVVWGGLTIAGFWLVGAVLLGGWRFAHHIGESPHPKPTIPEGLFGWAMIIAFFFLLSEIKSKFSNTRSIIQIFRGKPIP